VDIKNELKKISLFRDFDDGHLEKLAEICRERSLNQHDILFREGEEGDELLMIVLGTIRLEKTSESGSPEEIATLASGSYVGEVALVSRPHKHMATAVAVEKTFVIGLHEEDVERVCSDDAELAAAFWKAMSRGLARRLVFYADEAAHYRALALHHDG